MKKLEFKIKFTAYYNIETSERPDAKERFIKATKEASKRIKRIKDIEITSSRRRMNKHTGVVTVKTEIYTNETGRKTGEYIKKKMREKLLDIEPDKDPHIRNNEGSSWSTVISGNGKPDWSKEAWKLEDTHILDVNDHLSYSSEDIENTSIDLDMDKNVYQSGSDEKTPKRVTMRQLYPREFRKAHKEIIEDINKRIDRHNYKSKLRSGLFSDEVTEWDKCSSCDSKNIELHHTIVKEQFKKKVRKVIARNEDKVLVNEETGELHIEESIIEEIMIFINHPEVLTPMCESCHNNIHHN